VFQVSIFRGAGLVCANNVNVFLCYLLGHDGVVEMNIEEIKKLIRDLSFERDFLSASKFQMDALKSGKCKIVIGLEDSYKDIFTIDTSINAIEFERNIAKLVIDMLGEQIKAVESKCFEIESKIKELAK
jgi:hypothetical protein